MTQIKLRRDTAANFTSKNPVLGIGEPAYETDTKKLKIGDGTTAYNSLDYFAGGGGSTEFTVVQPLKLVDGTLTLQIDEQTIQVQNGKLVANLDELGNEVNTLAGDVAGVQADLANKQDKSTAVTLDTAQTISGQKEFNKTVLFLSNNNLIRGQQSSSYRNGAGLSMGSNSTSTDGGPFAPQWKIYNTAGNVDRTESIITTYNQSKLNNANFNTASKLVRLDSDGKLPAIDGSNLTNLPSSSTSVEKHGLEGDYCSKYGIVDCPNGILTEGTGQVTLKAGVVMQMTETNGLTTNASDMAHDITSTVDFDLFYTSGSLLEATQVVFSEQEPEDGATGVLAWYNGTQWKFKSNDAGNVWRTAPAVRLAHIHITDGNITRIDYIGNRHLNKVIPVTTDTAQTISGAKTFTQSIKIGGRLILPDGLGVIQNTTGVRFLTMTSSDIEIGESSFNIGIYGSSIRFTSNSVVDKDDNTFLTSGDKETIMEYVMPDYSTRTEVPWNTDNTAPTDGYVEVFGQGDGSTSAFVLEYTLNGTKTAVASCYATSANTNFRLPVICPKGTTYSARGGANGHALHFISMKGAV